MKKIIVLIALQILSVAGMCSAQSATQFLTFNDNNGVPDAGTYNPNDSFSFDIFLTFSGYNASGLSFWFETTADAAPYIRADRLYARNDVPERKRPHFSHAFYGSSVEWPVYNSYSE